MVARRVRGRTRLLDVSHTAPARLFPMTDAPGAGEARVSIYYLSFQNLCENFFFFEQNASVMLPCVIVRDYWGTFIDNQLPYFLATGCMVRDWKLRRWYFGW